MTRIRTLIPALALAVSAFAAPAFAATQIADGGFEQQGAGVATGGYCYFNMDTGGGPACGAGAWSGAGAGLQDETNQPWPGQPTADGSKYGFVQSGGVLSQFFTADETGLFTLSWMDAGRPSAGGYDGNQTYDVLLQAIGGPVINLGSFGTANYQAFTARSTGQFLLTAGQTYTLAFQGTAVSGDHTSFIDGVSLAGGAVPEPATWGLMLMGFGGLGAMLRAKRRRLALAAI